MRKYLVWFFLYYLRFWAKFALFISRPYVIGVAGSVGKSSTRNALYAVLKDHFKTYMVYGNSETGIPLGILGIKVKGFNAKRWLEIFIKAPFKIFNLIGFKYLIVEMGIDDPYPPKNMSYLLTILKPDMSIDLNATATHTQQFEKILQKNSSKSINYLIKRIAEEDSKIITNGYTKIGIYNADDKNLDRAIKLSKNNNLRIMTFGENSKNDVFYNNYSITLKKTKFSYKLNTQKGIISIDLTFPGMLLPPASKESFAAVVLAARTLGLTNQQIKDALNAYFTIPKGRSTLFEGINNTIIIDSSYNSSKSTVFSFLKMLKILKKRTGRSTVFVMGDMRELGQKSKEEHEEVASEIIGNVDILYCVGPLTKEYVIPYIKTHSGRKTPRRIEWYKNSVQAGLHLKEDVPKKAIVLFKGSQNTIYLEEAIKFLLANPHDSKKLTRQEQYWLEEKQRFFTI